jgi:LPXTG-motif cell wall-anchored protein
VALGLRGRGACGPACNTRGVRVCRVTITWLLALGALLLLGPGAALASGPSAGDQQYTDPLGGSSTPSSQPSSSSSSSSGSGTSSGSSAPVTQGTSASAGSSSPTASTTTSTSTGATTAATTGTTTSSASTSTLPRTGFDAWLAAGLGLALLGTGVAVRRRIPLT